MCGDLHTLKLQGEIGILSHSLMARHNTRMTYFMKEKSKVFMKFKQYKSFIKTQTSQKLKKLHINGGGEFINKEFKKFLLDNGIQLEITAPHSPSQNGIAK
jgi:transposase InsO family protein